MYEQQQPMPCQDCSCPCHIDNDEDPETPDFSLTHGTNFNMVGTGPQHISTNPFRNNNRTPAATACFSKSFLYVKNMVKTRRAQWELIAEGVDDLTKSDDFRGNAGGDCPSCRSNINWEKRGSIDKKDKQEKLKSKYHSQLPYELEPLHINRSNSEEIIRPYSVQNEQVGSNNSNDNKKARAHSIQSEVQGIRKSFDEDVSLIVDTVRKKKFSFTDEELENINSYSRTTNTKQSHLNPTNPFSVDLQHIHPFENKSRISHDEETAKKPISVQSEVKNIRKSFEEGVADVVANVNRKSFDLNTYRMKEAAVVKPFERNAGTQQSPSSNIEQPHSMQSQVRTIRNSFEEDASQVLDQVDNTEYEWKRPEYNQEIRKSFGEQLHLGKEDWTRKKPIYGLNSEFNFRKDANNEMTNRNTMQANQNEEEQMYRTEMHLNLQNGHGQKIAEAQKHNSGGRRWSDQAKQNRRDSYPKASEEGLLAVAIHDRTFDRRGLDMIKKQTSNYVQKTTEQDRHQKPQFYDNVQSQDCSNYNVTMEGKESSCITWISVPASQCACDEFSGKNSEFNLIPQKSGRQVQEILHNVPSVGTHEANAKSSIALQMYGRGIRHATMTEEGDVFNKPSTKHEYDNVFVTPSNLQVEAIGRSVSVLNTSAGGHNRNQDAIIASRKRMSSGDKGKSYLTELSEFRKKQFYICHKCHKIVETGEAAFHLLGGLDTAWHRHCFKCNMCQKVLSETDHGFFDNEPYCIDDYVKVAKIPKCFKCQQLIFDSNYTSAAGHSWHRDHFVCHSCKKPLVDTKYVFVQNKYPYCFPCHEKDFAKYCKTCQERISPEDPYVQSGDLFWHSNNTCLKCSTCKRSLVGRSLLFRKDGLLYCNRYCAVQEI